MLVGFILMLAIGAAVHAAHVREQAKLIGLVDNRNRASDERAD